MASVLDTRCGGMEEWLEGSAFGSMKNAQQLQKMKLSQSSSSG